MNFFRSTHMARKEKHRLQSLPTANYSSAIARAVEWMGDRYLLAKPINAAANRATAAVARNVPRLSQ
jgi:hypothetical protein